MKILNDILEGIPISNIHGNIDARVSSVSLSSNTIEPNSLFIAIAGNVVDGHDFIIDCINKGATVIVHEKDIEWHNEGVIFVQVPNTHEAAGIIASNFYGNPSSYLKLIGITGTNGKTTTATLLHQLFCDLGHKTGMIGTVVNKINDKSFEANRTTPDPITLNKLLADMVDEGCEYCFMEVSSHSVSEKRISGLSFIGGVFTNLTLDHLDYHLTMENYRDTKKEFFNILPANGFALVNIDDPYGEFMVSPIKAKKYTYSLKDEADFNERLETKLIGEFNAYNILGIYGVAILLGEDENKVKEIIKNLEAVPGRFEYIKGVENKITGIVDYAHTPDALENVLKTANKIKDEGRLITVIGCGGDRDKSKRPIMAKIGYDMSDILVLTSDNPRTESPVVILDEMKEGIKGLPENKVHIIVDRHEAIAKACLEALPNDIIVIAGKGHEKYQEINGLKTHFDDIEELKKYLK